MSNRCELYSTNFIPGSGEADGNRVIGIAEWGYDVPLIFKLLLTGEPRSCKSLIFDGDDEIALFGRYDHGVANMIQFLERLSPHYTLVESLRGTAEAFLNSPENRSEYLVLEGGEIFAADSESIYDANQKLLTELGNLEPQMSKAIAEIKERVWEETHPPGFLARLFGARVPIRKQDSKDLVESLGLGGWTNHLFYTPRLG